MNPIKLHYVEISDHGQNMVECEELFETMEDYESFVEDYLERAWVIVNGSWVDFGDGIRHNLRLTA